MNGKRRIKRESVCERNVKKRQEHERDRERIEKKELQERQEREKEREIIEKRN